MHDPIGTAQLHARTMGVVPSSICGMFNLRMPPLKVSVQRYCAALCVASHKTILQTLRILPGRPLPLKANAKAKWQRTLVGKSGPAHQQYSGRLATNLPEVPLKTAHACDEDADLAVRGGTSCLLLSLARVRGQRRTRLAQTQARRLENLLSGTSGNLEIPSKRRRDLHAASYREQGLIYAHHLLNFHQLSRIVADHVLANTPQLSDHSFLTSR